MAQPSSSRTHDDESRHHRHHRSERSSSHHHHRTISSTTLLLILSLVLAVLAVMLSLPSNSPLTGASNPAEPTASGVWNILTPKRTQQLIAREKEVAMREAEVARREAELLAGAPGGVVQTPSSTPILCPPCAAAPTAIETVYAPAQTVIKEIIKEDSLTPPGWTSPRADEILDRELRVAEREREIGKREESVNRREHDASRRESWIMEQLIVLGNDQPMNPVVEEEYVYEQPAAKRKAKYLPQHQYEQYEPEPPVPPVVRRRVEPSYEYEYEPAPVVAETQYETATVIQVVTETTFVPSPASTRPVAFPTPNVVSHAPTSAIPKTTSVEIITEEELPVPVPEEEYEEEEEEEIIVETQRRARPRATQRRPPANPERGGWLW